MASSAELSQLIADKEGLLREAIGVDYKVEQAILVLQKEILEKQREKKDLEIKRSESNYNIKSLKIEISTLTKTFWNTKNQGL